MLRTFCSSRLSSASDGETRLDEGSAAAELCADGVALAATEAETLVTTSLDLATDSELAALGCKAAPGATTLGSALRLRPTR